jgi:hypothetical protein
MGWLVESTGIFIRRFTQIFLGTDWFGDAMERRILFSLICEILR